MASHVCITYCTININTCLQGHLCKSGTLGHKFYMYIMPRGVDDRTIPIHVCAYAISMHATKKLFLNLPFLVLKVMYPV